MPETETTLADIEVPVIWKSVNSLNFNYGEFAIIESDVGLNSYWIRQVAA